MNLIATFMPGDPILGQGIAFAESPSRGSDFRSGRVSRYEGMATTSPDQVKSRAPWPWPGIGSSYSPDWWKRRGGS
jgi:hypothetical protein